MDQHSRISTSAILTESDVAHLVGLPRAAVRRWSQPGKHRSPIISQGTPGRGASRPTIPLIGLCEATAAKSLKDRGIGSRKVASIITDARAVDPLAFARDFYTDGTDVFRAIRDELERIKDGQFALRDVFQDSLRRLNFDTSGVMESYTIAGGDSDPAKIVIDPRFSAGRPIIERTGTPVFAILSLLGGGEARHSIAQDFGLDIGEVSFVDDHRQFLAPVA